MSWEKLDRMARQNDSLLCIGLDPRPEQFPADILAQDDPILAFNRQIIEATRDLVCAYKPNYAFYEVHGLAGLRALRRTIEAVGPEIPVILDAKRGDIGSTAAAYARAAFEVWGADAVTVQPYLGRDAVTPFTDYAGRGVFVLCHTSNPGASELQTLTGPDGTPLYLHVARLAESWSETANVGLVVGATYPQALRAVRNCAPQTWILVPGIGAQGGDLDAVVSAGLRPDGLGLVINVSRAVCHAPDPRAAALAFRDRIRAARASQQEQAVAGNVDPQTETLILDLAHIGAVRLGSFTLKSGQTSPIYIDLRLLASHPQVLARVAAAYAAVLQSRSGPPIAYDRLAAIPYAALPIGTAVALQTGRPLIYPRKEVKSYGTRRAIEGVFQPGERAVVLDDLITTGESKIEAITPLREAGLDVRDVVVLIDRQSGGREVLARRGYRLHAVLTLRQILDVLLAHDQITQEQHTQVVTWLA
jgi:uridine monophosphate synthetase